MFIRKTYFYFEYFFNILSFLSEYTSGYVVDKTKKMSIEFVKDKISEQAVEDKVDIKVAKSLNTHKEICDLYVTECKQKSIEFINYNDFVEKFISYSQTFGITKITKINKKYLEDSFYLLKFDINKGIEKVHLQSL